ncbi:hypothetical protein OIU91_28105 [Streptomyces sp. NBC_01456]|uniref:hypothetical protein n=1 Tax=unclassified Streptomyces TaxID=2593676 RepID=UPI002E35E49D|nr:MULTISPECIES: hypothetical protein [unclassified Streptomyces]
MSTSKRISALAATTALVGLTTFGITAPAATAATTAPKTAVAAAGGTAPACIHRQVHTILRYARISNWCGKTMRVKVIVDGDFDSPCNTLHNGSNFSWSWGPTGSYRKTVVC